MAVGPTCQSLLSLLSPLSLSLYLSSLLSNSADPASAAALPAHASPAHPAGSSGSWRSSPGVFPPAASRTAAAGRWALTMTACSARSPSTASPGSAPRSARRAARGPQPSSVRGAAAPPGAASSSACRQREQSCGATPRRELRRGEVIRRRHPEGTRTEEEGGRPAELAVAAESPRSSTAKGGAAELELLIRRSRRGGPAGEDGPTNSRPAAPRALAAAAPLARCRAAPSPPSRGHTEQGEAGGVGALQALATLASPATRRRPHPRPGDPPPPPTEGAKGRRRSPAASVQPRGCRGAFAVLSPDRRGRGRAPPPLQLSWGGGPPAELPCPRAAAVLARPRPRRCGAPPPAGFCSARDGLGERGGDGQGAREGAAAGERKRGRERERGRKRETREREKIKLTCGPHRHVVSTSAKTTHQNRPMAKNERF